MVHFFSQDYNKTKEIIFTIIWAQKELYRSLIHFNQNQSLEGHNVIIM